MELADFCFVYAEGLGLAIPGVFLVCVDSDDVTPACLDALVDLGAVGAEVFYADDFACFELVAEGDGGGLDAGG